MSEPDYELEALKVQIAEKEASIRRKEKKLEIQRHADGGSPMRAAELRRMKAEEMKEQAKKEAEIEQKNTLTSSGVPLVQRREELIAEIEAAEQAHEQQEARLDSLEEELRQEVNRYNAAKQEKEDFCKTLLELVADLQKGLAEKLAAARSQDIDGDDSSAPYTALQKIQELTKEREAEISNNERQLREICQIISMKKEREQELQNETDEKIRKAKLQKDGEILAVVQRCQRERADVMGRVEKLRQENEQQAACLHWKHQKTLREMKDRKIDRTSTKGIRAQITVDSTTGATKAKKGKSDAKAEPALRLRPKPKTVDVPDVEKAREEMEEEKLKIKMLEGDITKVQSEFQKAKRQLEQKIQYERGQAEQFERENQKLEEQADHLAQTLQNMKLEIKKQQASNPELAAISWPGGATTPRNINSPKPTRR